MSYAGDTEPNKCTYEMKQYEICSFSGFDIILKVYGVEMKLNREALIDTFVIKRLATSEDEVS